MLTGFKLPDKSSMVANTKHNQELSKHRPSKSWICVILAEKAALMHDAAHAGRTTMASLPIHRYSECVSCLKAVVSPAQ